MCQQKNSRFVLCYRHHHQGEGHSDLSPLPEVTDLEAFVENQNNSNNHLPQFQKRHIVEEYFIFTLGSLCVLSSVSLIIPTRKLITKQLLHPSSRFYLDLITVFGSSIWLLTLALLHLPRYDTKQFESLTGVFHVQLLSLYFILGLNGIVLKYSSMHNPEGFNWENVSALDFVVIHVFVVFLVFEFLFALHSHCHLKWRTKSRGDEVLVFISICVSQLGLLSCLFA